MDIIRNTMQFYFVVLKMHGLKDSDSNIIIILYMQTGQSYGVGDIYYAAIIERNSTARR